MGFSQRTFSCDRITVFKTAVVTRDDPWEKVDRGRILLAGSVTPDLRRLLERHGRGQINHATSTADYPNGMFSGSALDRLRQHLGLTESSGAEPYNRDRHIRPSPFPSLNNQAR